MSTDQLLIRDACAEDLEGLVMFEIEIARISFPDSPLDDPAFHVRRINAALEDEREGTFVAVGGGLPLVVGWAWISIRTNFLTKDRYGFLRSLAVAASARGSAVADALLERSIAFAENDGSEEVIGKVHVNNLAMRVAYASAGFDPTHLTMRLRPARRQD